MSVPNLFQLFHSPNSNLPNKYKYFYMIKLYYLSIPTSIFYIFIAIILYIAISKLNVFIPTYLNIKEEGASFIDTPSSLLI